MINIVADHPLRIGNAGWRKAVLKEHSRILSHSSPGSTSLNISGLSTIIDVAAKSKEFSTLQHLASKDFAEHLKINENSNLKNSFCFKLSPESLSLMTSSIKATGIARDAASALGGRDIVFHSPCGLFAKTVEINENHDIAKVDGSGFWHRDSIGCAIKIFVCLDARGRGVRTELIQGSQIMDPFVREWEMARVNPSGKDLCQFEQSVFMSNASKIASVSLSAGQCFAFNTNAVHRGAYILNPPGSRLTVQITMTTRTNAKLFDLIHQTKYSENLCDIHGIQ